MARWVQPCDAAPLLHAPPCTRSQCGGSCCGRTHRRCCRRSGRRAGGPQILRGGEGRGAMVCIEGRPRLDREAGNGGGDATGWWGRAPRAAGQDSGHTGVKWLWCQSATHQWRRWPTTAAGGGKQVEAISAQWLRGRRGWRPAAPVASPALQPVQPLPALQPLRAAPPTHQRLGGGVALGEEHCGVWAAAGHAVGSRQQKGSSAGGTAGGWHQLLLPGC